jgi:UDP-N-acetylglucosamine--N-acetylmuramyl-(pentapeptide) pyrophosphoryl-undecaprenol N-acetylglucosamine transferase
MHDGTAKTLFVANAGGHLEELWQLQPRFSNVSRSSRAWVTWDSPQARSLLEGEECMYVDRSEPRDVVTMLRNAKQAREILGSAEWSDVVSTGSVMALPFLALARARGMRCHFIESAARTEGPSLTGRLLERVPGVHRYCQYQAWADRRTWSYGGSVFDGFGPAEPPDTLARTGIRFVVVTLGSNTYDFGRLVEGIRNVLPPGAEVLWQTGHTDVSKLDIRATPFLPSADLADAMRKADLVVAHAGVGSALAALSVGRTPLLVPRRKHRGEHVDDHQVQVARHLVHRGIALACDAEQLNPEIIAIAAASRVQEVVAPEFVLKG